MSTSDISKTNINDAVTHVSSTPVPTKNAFIKWLSNSNLKKYTPEMIISCIDRVSEYATKRKISRDSLWEYKSYDRIKPIYSKLLEARLFRITDRKTYNLFIVAGQFYLRFLKENSFNATVTFNETASVESDALSTYAESYPTNVSLPDLNAPIYPFSEGKADMALASCKPTTIKEAIIYVLKLEQRSMTADEIYEKIIQAELYSFGAEKPNHVVRNIIESACDNSGYSEKYRAATPCFHFERNSDGKRVYSILETSSADVPKKSNSIISTDKDYKCTAINIWSDTVEQKFRKWLERENYSKRTSYNYCRAIAKTICSYNDLAQKAIKSSNSEKEAIRRYIAILNKDVSFAEKNSARHHQFSAALAALERFYTSNVQAADKNDRNLLTKAPKEMGSSDSYLNDIIDLEVGVSGIRQILKNHFHNLYGYSNINILWDAAQIEFPMFLNDNAINEASNLWQFMLRIFAHEYTLSNPHIWNETPTYPQNVRGLVVNLARQYDGTVTREQINDYFMRIQIGSPVNQVLLSHGELLFYGCDRFVAAETINLSMERTKEIALSLADLFSDEITPLIVLRDIQTKWFTRLPRLKDGISWTPLLLQEVLRIKPDIGYRVIMPNVKGQAYDTLGAALVPNDSDITTFADAVHIYCSDKFVLPHSLSSEDLRIELRNAGMLEGNELIYNLHKALVDYRFAFNLENTRVRILES